jgi:hypothetical protein
MALDSPGDLPGPGGTRRCLLGLCDKALTQFADTPGHIPESIPLGDPARSIVLLDGRVLPLDSQQELEAGAFPVVLLQIQSLTMFVSRFVP